MNALIKEAGKKSAAAALKAINLPGNDKWLQLLYQEEFVMFGNVLLISYQGEDTSWEINQDNSLPEGEFGKGLSLAEGLKAGDNLPEELEAPLAAVVARAKNQEFQAVSRMLDMDLQELANYALRTGDLHALKAVSYLNLTADILMAMVKDDDLVAEKIVFDHVEKALSPKPDRMMIGLGGLGGILEVLNQRRRQ